MHIKISREVTVVITNVTHSTNVLQEFFPNLICNV
jgi:hypothetical protein